MLIQNVCRFIIHVLSNEVDGGNLAAPVVALMAHNIILGKIQIVSSWDKC